jgi:hypothetical protein
MNVTAAVTDPDAFDPHVWSGRAWQEDFEELVVSGLASMYPAFDWSVVLRAIMDISAHAISLSDRPRLGQVGHQCSHVPGRPNLHLVSSSRRPRQVSYSTTLANDHAA